MSGRHETTTAAAASTPLDDGTDNNSYRDHENDKPTFFIPPTFCSAGPGVFAGCARAHAAPGHPDGSPGGQPYGARKVDPGATWYAKNFDGHPNQAPHPTGGHAYPGDQVHGNNWPG